LEFLEAPTFGRGVSLPGRAKDDWISSLLKQNKSANKCGGQVPLWQSDNDYHSNSAIRTPAAATKMTGPSNFITIFISGASK
jgi:hypothetical protein